MNIKHKSSIPCWQIKFNMSSAGSSIMTKQVSSGDARMIDVHKSINVTYHRNRSKDPNHMTISIGIEKPCDPIQHLLMIEP